MKEIRVGAIGVGDIFVYGHIPAYAKLPEARLVALADPSEKSLRRALAKIKDSFSKEAENYRKMGYNDLAERLTKIMKEIRTYNNYHKMLEEEDIELVDVCTPHKYHYPIVIDSLRAGVNVMVEKPMARTYIEALEIVKTVKKTKKLFQLNENYVFAGGFYKVHKLVKSGDLGEVEYVIVPCSHEGPEWKEWFWDPIISGGGSLLDLGSHAIGVAWYLIGFDKRPKVVKAEKFTGITLKVKDRYIVGEYKSIKVEDDAHVLVRFEDQYNGSWITALIEGSWTGPEYECTMIFGTKSYLKVKGVQGKAMINVMDYTGRKREIEVSQGNTIVSEILNMCKCISSGKRSFLNEELGAEIMAIIDTAYYSEMKGRVAVTLDEFKEFIKKLVEEHGDKASEEFIKMKIRCITKH